MINLKRYRNIFCLALNFTLLSLCFPAVSANAPSVDTIGTLETTVGISVKQGDAVNLTVNLRKDLKYNNGLPIQLVDSVLPSQYDVAVYLRVMEENDEDYGPETAVTPWIKVWDDFLLTDKLKFVSVTNVTNKYKIYSYVDGKGNYPNNPIQAGG